MVKIEYNEISYEDLLRLIARQVKGKLSENVMVFPEEICEGKLWRTTLHNDVQLLMYDYTPKESILYQQKKGTKDFYTLRFDDVIQTPDAQESKSSVFFTHTKQSAFYMASPGVHIRGVNFLFNKEWMDAYLAAETAGSDILQYMALKMTGPFNYEVMDAEYNRLLSELLQASSNNRADGLVLRNRAMLLMERFFLRFFKKITERPLSVRMSPEEIARLREVESELIKDFTAEPPTIPKLARLAAMSPSKLKQTFKVIYGMPVYQYYQKHRMNKAKAMLLSKNYSEHEVASELGFANRSNFLKAFYKSFGHLNQEMSAAS